MKLITKLAVTVLTLCCSTLPGLAQSPGAGSVVPSLIRFSGAVTDIQGKPLSGMAGLTFAIYPNQSTGAPLWLETQNVTLDANGHYTVYLGGNHAAGVPVDMFLSGEARWLGVQPEGQAEQPRVLLVSVPYALKAADADTLGGLPASSYVTVNQLPVASRQSPVAAAHDDAAAEAGSEVTPACASLASDGAATANYIAKWTSPCNLENSPIYVAPSTGYIGIGTIAPQAPFDAETAAQTATSGTLYGGRFVGTFNPTASSSAINIGLQGQANTSSGNAQNFTAYLAGTNFQTQHYGTGTVSTMYGAYVANNNHAAGTITNASGLYSIINNLSTGTITNGYGVQVASPLNIGGGVFTNYYGVYISNPTGVTNSWGLYTLANTNYVSGKLGIGTAAPTQALEVSGNLKLDGSGHGITYPDGTVQMTASLPGTGTITKVTAGTDLTGGGGSGAVTVNLDTTKVPTLAAATNTFNGSITALSFSGNGSNITAVNAEQLNGFPSGSFAQLSAASNPFTGAVSASSFSGNGAGLTNVNAVNAAQLGGIAASGYPTLAATPNVFTGTEQFTSSQGGALLYVDNSYSGSARGIDGIVDGTNGIGVYGEADQGTSAHGIWGYSGGTSVAGGTGVYGLYGSNSSEGADRSTSGYGIWADTSTGTGALLATADSAVAGAFINDNGGSGGYLGAALWAENDYPQASADEYVFVAEGAESGGIFPSCSVDTTGSFNCSGSVGGAARTRDQRSLETYSMQSTENWYEDFGSGRMQNGAVTVALDADFADVANTGVDYHVFLTPMGDTRGLYVASKSATSFEVREAGGGHSSVAFDYRIVAKRKGMEALRLRDITARENQRLLAGEARRAAAGAEKPPTPERPHHNERMPFQQR